MDDILDRYPGIAGQPLAMALMCEPLIQFGHHADAFALGQAAIRAAPGDTGIRDLVGKSLSADVPAFHLGMLRDRPRNACYEAAIARTVRPGMRVLEIGTGAGLLALLAARAGAEVVTCESNPIIAEAARAIVARNGLSERITVIAKPSTALEIGVDLPERCELLVSELFGDDLFEEGVVGSIGDARARLLLPGAPVVPPRAHLCCALVMHHRPDRHGLDDVLGFDLSPFAPLAKTRRQLPGSPTPHAALRSAAVPALAVDFESPIGTLRERIALVSTGGRVDGIAHWLHLDFGDGVAYENAPFTSPEAHWRVPVDAFDTPRETRPGEVIEVEVRTFDKRLIVAATG